MNKPNLMRIIGAVVIALLVASIIVLPGQAANEKSEQGTSKLQYENLDILQMNATYADECLKKNWGVDANGTTQYPETFAGEWIDGSMLVIAVTDSSDEVKANYIKNAYPYGEYLKFVEMVFSYNDLYNTAREIGDFLVANGAPLSEYYVDQKQNAICLGLDTQGTELDDWGTLVKEYYADIPIVVSYSPYESTMTTYLLSGRYLYNSEAPCSMTLSCCGTYNGNNVVLTCGHGGQAEDNQVKYLSSSGSTIGTVTFHRYNNNQYGDFELIPITGANFFPSASIALERSITGAIYSPSVNTSIHWFGAKTAQESHGSVYAVGVTVYPDGGSIAIYGMTKVLVTNGDCKLGDSGAPFYQLDGESALYCGVLHGKGSHLGYSYVYFTPYTYISSIGFSIWASED